jgi:hypothetical protein
MFLADKQAAFHVDQFTGTCLHPFLDVVAVVHTRRGLVCGGDLVLVTPDTTRIALEMKHGSIAIINAKRDMHASTAAFAADGNTRLVASLYCEPRLVELANERGRCITRFATWPPSQEEVAKYKRTPMYISSAAGKLERAPRELANASAKLAAAELALTQATTKTKTNRATAAVRSATESVGKWHALLQGQACGASKRKREV